MIHRYIIESTDEVKGFEEAIERLDREWGIEELEPCEDAISRQAVDVRLEEIINEMETIFADIREKNVDDSVCGLCEYDCDHGLDGSSFGCLGFEKDDCFKLKDEYRKEWANTEALPSVAPQPKAGRWIEEYIGGPYDVCSECRQKLTKGYFKYNYCPNCGAKMELESEVAECH